MVISLPAFWARTRFHAEERGLVARAPRRRIAQAFEEARPLHEAWLMALGAKALPVQLRQQWQSARWAYETWAADPCWGPSCQLALRHEETLGKMMALAPYSPELVQAWHEFNLQVEAYWRDTLGHPSGPKPWHSRLLASAA